MWVLEKKNEFDKSSSILKNPKFEKNSLVWKTVHEYEKVFMNLRKDHDFKKWESLIRKENENGKLNRQRKISPNKTKKDKTQQGKCCSFRVAFEEEIRNKVGRTRMVPPLAYCDLY